MWEPFGTAPKGEMILVRISSAATNALDGWAFMAWSLTNHSTNG